MTVAAGTPVAGTLNTTAPKVVSFTMVNASGILYVKVIWAGGAAVNTGCTYGGVAMTQVGVTANGTTHAVAIYRLKNAALGANNISAAFSSAINNNLIAVEWAGVDSGAPENTYVGTTTVSGNISLAVATATDQMTIDAAAAGNTSNINSITKGASQTLESSTSVVGLIAGGSHWMNGTPMAWTETASEAMTLGAVALKPEQLPLQPHNWFSPLVAM